MKIQMILIGFLLCLLKGGIYAQDNEEERHTQLMQAQEKGLKIGDQVPDVLLDKIVHADGTVTSGKLSDYADRLLILDFMYTTCSSCIGGLPHKDQLQKEFGDRVKIMTVVGGELYSPGMIARENTDFIKKYLTNPNSFLSIRGVQIPWVVENKTLNTLFPHILVSHLVWIYKGKVLAFTEGDYVDRHNIKMILAGKNPELPLKNDFVSAVDEKTALIIQGHERFTGKISKHYVAVFPAYQDGVETRSGTMIDSVKRTRRDYIINLPILNIYTSRWMQVLDTFFTLDPTSIVLEVKDPSMYVGLEDKKEYNLVSRNKTNICYESVRPATGQSDKEVALTTIHDLDHLLGLNGRFEQRKMKSLILVRTDSIDRLRSKGIPKAGDAKLDPPNMIIRNQKLDLLVWQLNQQYGNPPVFDETGYSAMVDMDLQLNGWKDIPALRAQLNTYGLDLREEEREQKVFVLTEQYKP
ncbi:TlpA family protein disulfide reductase [Sphingobacterium faecium]|uniref:TlpA family protein disulfide reductase n=1 Tax=Sphingobacterium faecium TaxID=34087 RepID=UPI003209FD18